MTQDEPVGLSRLAPFVCVLAFCNSAHAQSPPPRASQTVLVHLDGDEDATLQVKEGDDWITYCKAPCNERVGADALFRVSGFDVRNSPPFELRAEAGASQIVHVESTSTSGYVIGSTLVVLGAIGLTTGVVLDFLGVTAEACDSPADGSTSNTAEQSFCYKPWHNLSDIGIGVGVASLVGIAGGVALMLANGHSSVTQSASRSRHPQIAILGVGARGRTEAGAASPFGAPSHDVVPHVSVMPLLKVSF